MARRKCANCGAPLKKNSYFCEYCGADWAPPLPDMNTPIGPDSAKQSLPEPEIDQKQVNKDIGIMILLFMFFWPAGLIYTWVKARVSIRTKALITGAFILLGFMFMGASLMMSDSENTDGNQQIADTPVPGKYLGTFKPDEVRTVMEDKFTRYGDRKQYWDENWKGNIVRAQGKVKNVFLHNNTDSKITIDSENPKWFSYDVYFPSNQNESLSGLKKGDTLKFEARLDRFYQNGQRYVMKEGKVLP